MLTHLYHPGLPAACDQCDRYGPESKIAHPGAGKRERALFADTSFPPEWKRLLVWLTAPARRKVMRMRMVLAAIILALIAAPAQAQHMRGKKAGQGQHEGTGEKKKKSEELDRAYRAATEKQPDQKPADPWRDMR